MCATLSLTPTADPDTTVDPATAYRYGILSVMMQLFLNPERLFEIPNTAFAPAPKVAVVLPMCFDIPHEDAAVVRVILRRQIRQHHAAGRGEGMKEAGGQDRQAQRLGVNALAACLGRSRRSASPAKTGASSNGWRERCPTPLRRGVRSAAD